MAAGSRHKDYTFGTKKRGPLVISHVCASSDISHMLRVKLTKAFEGLLDTLTSHEVGLKELTFQEIFFSGVTLGG